MYKNYKIHCKIFNPPMEKVAILLWHIWIYRNEIVVKKIQSNPFLVIKKATLNFQSLQDFVTEWCNVPWVVEKLIRWIPLINGIFKLNFDGSRIKIKITSEWFIRDSNGIIKMATSRHMGNI